MAQSSYTQVGLFGSHIEIAGSDFYCGLLSWRCVEVSVCSYDIILEAKRSGDGSPAKAQCQNKPFIPPFKEFDKRVRPLGRHFSRMSLQQSLTYFT